MKKRLNIGIIPDGNRRWAAERGLPVREGHREGAKRAKAIMTHILDRYKSEIKSVTIWAFSSENFGRNAKERKEIFDIVRENLHELMKDKRMVKNKVRVNIVGTRLDKTPASLKETAMQTVELTKDYGKHILNIALGYGGRFEIMKAAMRLAQRLKEKPFIKELTEETFEKFLDIKEPLDILIRTGGEHRLSGFMLYQAAYSELFFIDKLWPDFTVRDFDMVMEEFRLRERRFGK